MPELPRMTAKEAEKLLLQNDFSIDRQKGSHSDRIYICKECGNEMHRDINASINILNRALESFELGINSLDYKQQALCVS
ncbi:hypothetical protein EWU84_08805 [Campylobacter coli]|nr:hypothetical protein [Campylobacter coli]